MPKSKKYKSDNGGGFEELRKHPPVTCILHVSNMVKYFNNIILC